MRIMLIYVIQLYVCVVLLNFSVRNMNILNSTEYETHDMCLLFK